MQGPFPPGLVTWRDLAEGFIRVFSLHLQFQHLGDIASLQHWPLAAETCELRKLCSRSQIGKLSTRVNTSNLLMSCTNIYGAISSPSGRRSASKPANLWHGIYWQKCIIILCLRRKLGAAAWGRDVWAESSVREEEPERLVQQFPNRAKQGHCERCRRWDAWEHTGPSALGSAVVPLHCPSSSKLHWLWEDFEKRFRDLAGNPVKLQPAWHGHMQHLLDLLSRLFDRYTYESCKLPCTEFLRFCIPSQNIPTLKTGDSQL